MYLYTQKIIILGGLFMKKGISFIALLIVILIFLNQPNNSLAASGYFPPDTAASGNVNNMVLIYNGYYGGNKTYEGKEQGTYDKETLLPYVAHLNSNDVIDDTLFDTFLFLGLHASDGRVYHEILTNPANASIKSSWDWYINRLYTSNQQLDALNQATIQTANTLGLTNHKSKVYIMIPFPNSNITNFGDVDGDGIGENLQADPLNNRYKVVKWYIDTVLSRWNQANYSHLELKGFYWLQEDITVSNPGEVQLVKNTGNYLHSLGLKYSWCPWSQATQKHNWSSYSFDFCFQQPNHYFDKSNYDRITTIATNAQTYNQGIEMEFDDTLMFNSLYKKLFYDYLKGGLDYGYMTGALKGWYAGINGVYNLYQNKNDNGVTGVFDGRKVYEDIYKFVKGTYTPPENIAHYKPVYASSSESSTFAANNAVDSNYYSRWSSNYSDSQWLYVDLGQPYNVNSVRLHWESAYAKGYKIQVSNDATNWTDVFATSTGDGGVDEISFSPVSARYVRMLGTQRATAFGYSLYEFLVFDQSGGTAPVKNIALAKTSSASSYQSAGYESNKAFDGNSATRWGSIASDSQWIYVDLGQSRNVNRVILNWEAAYGKGYKIQLSNDAVTWTDVYTTTTGDGGTDDISFTATNARYVRMLGISRGTAFGYSLYDFEVYDVPNLALNKTVTASSSENAFQPISAVDGNPSTRWSSLYTNSEWLKVDLGQVNVVNRVKLNWESAYGSGYKIQVSNDGANWTDIFTTTTGNGGIDDISFAPVNARYVRLYGTQRATAFGYSVYEFEVYGN